VPSHRKVEEKLLRREKRYDIERRMREKRSEEYEVLEEVFDKSTLMTIYQFMNTGAIKKVQGIVNSGKESRIYLGIAPEGRELALKIYLIVSAEFKKGMLMYIQGDPRFKHIKHDTKSLVYSWALKEFKNLQKAYDSGVRVPKPIAVKNNVLIMEFIGENGVPAPLLREISLEDPETVYQRLLKCIKTLYQKARLVHGDLSEYNIMMWKGEPVVFDVSQAVPLEHPMADQLLHRDIENLNNYFKRLGIKVKPLDEAYEWVKSND
jgi:RIO kinase 1